MLLEIQMASYPDEIKEVFLVLVLGVVSGFLLAMMTEAFLEKSKWWKRFLALGILVPIFSGLTMVSLRATNDIFVWATWGLMYLVSLVLVFLRRK